MYEILKTLLSALYRLNKTKHFFAFTLAEVMIVLSIIGILTAILLPVAQNSTPNENILKFKKAHNTLFTTIRELVTSDQYYLNGDLGTKADGNNVEESNYLCESFANVISTKTKECQNFTTPDVDLSNTGLINTLNIIEESALKTLMDDYCKYAQQNALKSYVVAQDGSRFIEVNPEYPFGKIVYTDGGCSLKAKNNYYDIWDGAGYATNEQPCLHFTSGFYFVYKPFCIDIDEPNKDEEPFGYGIRVDGKIINGAKADKWLEKSIQEK